jgi:microcompartment protein CcmL/EutN
MSKKLSQRELDLESYERGRRRFYARIKVAMDAGRSSETGWGTLLTSAAIQPMTEHLEEMLPGETSVGATALRNLGLKFDRVALIALQSFMDGAAKSMTFSRVCIITAKTIQTEAILTAIRIKDKEKRLARYQQWVAHRTTQRRASELRKIVSRTFTDITNEFAWDVGLSGVPGIATWNRAAYSSIC